jgi:hypothetical protein
MLPGFVAAVLVLFLGALAPVGWGYGRDWDDRWGHSRDRDDGDALEETPFDEADVFLELNDTDGDLGIHALIDGDAWRRLEIEGPGEREMLDVRVSGRLGRQGLTELFLESDEPSFDELPPAQFLKRFPEGPYEIEGTTLGGEERQSTDVLTHVLPAPPANVRVSGVAAAENCDADPLPKVGEPIVIDWEPVTASHPEIGVPSAAIEIAGYQLVVEREEPTLLVFSVDLPPSVTEFEVPSDFIALGDAFKFEILAREKSGNRTAIESCFEVQ